MQSDPSKRMPVRSAVALSLSISPSKTMTMHAAPGTGRNLLTDIAGSAIADSFAIFATEDTSRE
jgi:hypothetical protein